MFKIEKKNINQFSLPEITHKSTSVERLILTENNLNMLKYFLDESDYRWETGHRISELSPYKPGTVLYLYSDGVVYYSTLELCMKTKQDYTAIEYFVDVW